MSVGADYIRDGGNKTGHAQRMARELFTVYRSLLTDRACNALLRS
jgi:hypothetical protein